MKNIYTKKKYKKNRGEYDERAYKKKTIKQIIFV